MDNMQEGIKSENRVSRNDKRTHGAITSKIIMHSQTCVFEKFLDFWFDEWKAKNKVTGHRKHPGEGWIRKVLMLNLRSNWADIKITPLFW